MALPRKNPNQRFSYHDYLQWHDDERWELIYGVPYNMTPAPSRKHQGISGQLFLQFQNHLRGKSCEVYFAPFDVRLVEKELPEDEIYNVVQPDLVIICDKSKLDDRGCLGAPDLIVEILSPSTSKKDRSEKYDLYEQFGVREYWIVDPLNESTEVYALNKNGKYDRSGVYGKEDTVQVKIFEDLQIDLTTIFIQ